MTLHTRRQHRWSSLTAVAVKQKITFLTWRPKQYAPPKHRWTSSPHDIISQYSSQFSGQDLRFSQRSLWPENWSVILLPEDRSDVLLLNVHKQYQTTRCHIPVFVTVFRLRFDVLRQVTTKNKSIILLPWAWRQKVLPKPRWTFTSSCDSFWAGFPIEERSERAAEWHKLVCLLTSLTDRYGSKSNLFDKFLAVQVNEGRTPTDSKECTDWEVKQTVARSLSALYRRQDNEVYILTTFSAGQTCAKCASGHVHHKAIEISHDTGTEKIISYNEPTGTHLLQKKKC
jgi:hypothetical protein